MLHHNSIEHIVVGGPAHHCRQLDKGDIILKVDGDEMTLESCPVALIGCDIPGTLVTLTVQKESGLEKVRL